MLSAFADRLVALAPERYQVLVRQFVKFGVTGSIGAIVDFGSYNLLTRGLGWDELITIGGYELIAANIVSVALAIMSNFFLNKYWTFRDTNEAVLKQGASFFALNGFTFVLNQILTSYFVFHVPLLASLFGSQRDNVAKALAIGFILFLNFFGSKALIFRQPKQRA